MGDIQLALKKADMKRNRFTLDVMADDKRVEKKDQTINEPVQFYTSGARIALRSGSERDPQGPGDRLPRRYRKSRS